MHHKINKTTPKQINEKIKYKKSSKIIKNHRNEISTVNTQK